MAILRIEPIRAPRILIVTEIRKQFRVFQVWWRKIIRRRLDHTSWKLSVSAQNSCARVASISIEKSQQLNFVGNLNPPK